MTIKRHWRNGLLVKEVIDGVEIVANLGSPQPVTNAYRKPTPPPVIVAGPWPLVLIPLKLLAKLNDRGAGDIIARTIGPVGGDAFKKWYKTLFGRDCGCGQRAETLNARWPL